MSSTPLICSSSGVAVRTGIGGAHDDGWRNDFGIFRNRQGAHAKKACHHNQDRQDAGKYRPVDKKSGNIHIQSLSGYILECEGRSGGNSAAGEGRFCLNARLAKARDAY